MRKLAIPVLAAVALLAGGCVISVADDRCAFSESREATVALDGASRVRVIAEAGALSVEGREGLGEVRVHGTACASHEGLLDDIELTARSSGGVVEVRVRLPRTSGWNRSAHLDLVVEMPRELSLEVDDGSGAMEIHDVAAVKVTDDSGGIEISAVAGDVEIEDDSGEIEVEGVGGDLTIEDDSGSIQVARVAGTVEIVDDDSGGIYIRDVGRDVRIRDDDSGTIEVRNVDGDLWIGDDDSGGIVAEDIRGDFTVERDGSGGIRYERIGGRVSIPDDD